MRKALGVGFIFMIYSASYGRHCVMDARLNGLYESCTMRKVPAALEFMIFLLGWDRIGAWGR